MATYELSKQLTTYRVDQKLLILLEEYLQKRTEELLKQRDETFNKIFSITIEFPDASETITTANELKGEYFPDDLKGICLYFSEYATLTVSLSFLLGRFPESKLKIKYKGENAREFVEGMRLRLEEILKPYKTFNYFWHPNMILSPVLFCLGFYPSIILFPKLFISQKSVSYYALIPVLLWTTYWICGKLNPFILFHTQRNHVIQQRIKWLALTTAGFFLVSILAMLGKFIFKIGAT